MTERRQFVGHSSTAEASEFTGLAREITVDMQAGTLRVHDGDTPGGYPLMRADMANMDPSVIYGRLSMFEQSTNKVDRIDATVTNSQYPGAKAVYDAITSINYIGDLKKSLQTTNHGMWLLCNGQAVSRTTYSKLFDLIGVTFGSGDGTTTFNVPDYRGKFLRGFGGDSAASFAETQSEGLPNITGRYNARCLLNTDNGYEAVSDGAFYKATLAVHQSAAGTDDTTHSAAIGFDASQSNSIYGSSQHVTPINQAANIFIFSGKELS